MSPLSDLVSPSSSVSVYATPAAPTPISEGGPAETSTPIRGAAAEELLSSPFPAPILTPLPSSRSPAPPSLPLPPARLDNRPVSPASGTAPTLEDTVAEAWIPGPACREVLEGMAATPGTYYPSR